MKERVQAALEKVKPALKADGGDVELVDVTPDGVVKVVFKGRLRWMPNEPNDVEDGN